jgi:hypothetical protein
MKAKKDGPMTERTAIGAGKTKDTPTTAHPEAKGKGGVSTFPPATADQSDSPTITKEHPETWPKPRPLSRLRAICDRLIARLGEEVPMDELSRYSGSLTVHSQVETLRSDYGLVIKNRCAWECDDVQRTCHSFYRLLGRAIPQVGSTGDVSNEEVVD